MAKRPESDSIIDMFARLGRELRMPDLDIERVIEHHRRNLEAFEKSARAASSGAARVMSRQREMLEEMARDIRTMSADFTPPSDPKALVEKQAEFARKGFETAVKNTGEVADLVAKSGGEALDILRERIREGMAEIRQSFEQKK